MKSAKKKDLSVLKRARPLHAKAVTLKYVKTGEELKVAFAIPAKNTKAVDRNRLRRQVKEILRHLEKTLDLKGTLLVYSRKADPQDYFELLSSIEKSFKKVL